MYSSGVFRSSFISYVSAVLEDHNRKTQKGDKSDIYKDGPVTRPIRELLESIEDRSLGPASYERILSRISQMITTIQTETGGLITPLDSKGIISLQNDLRSSCIDILSLYSDSINSQQKSASTRQLDQASPLPAASRESKNESNELQICEALASPSPLDNDKDEIPLECGMVAKAIKKQLSQKIDNNDPKSPSVLMPTAIISECHTPIKGFYRPISMDASLYPDLYREEHSNVELTESEARLLKLTPVGLFCSGNGKKILKQQVHIWINLVSLPKVLRASADPLEIKIRLYSLASGRLMPYSASAVINPDCSPYDSAVGSRDVIDANRSVKFMIRGLNAASVDTTVIIVYLYRISSFVDISDLIKGSQSRYIFGHVPVSRYTYTKMLTASCYLDISSAKLDSTRSTFSIKMNWIPAHLSCDNLEDVVTKNFVKHIKEIEGLELPQVDAISSYSTIIPPVRNPSQLGITAAMLIDPSRPDVDLASSDIKSAHSLRIDSNILTIQCAIIPVGNIVDIRKSLLEPEMSLKWCVDYLAEWPRKSENVDYGIRITSDQNIASMLEGKVVIQELCSRDDSELSSLSRKIDLKLKVGHLDLSTLDVGNAFSGVQGHATDHLMVLYVREDSGEFVSDCFRDASEYDMHSRTSPDDGYGAPKTDISFGINKLASSWSIFLKKDESKHDINQVVTIFIDRDLVNSSHIYITLLRVKPAQSLFRPSSLSNKHEQPSDQKYHTRYFKSVNPKEIPLIRASREDIVCITAAKISTLIGSRGYARLYKFIKPFYIDDAFANPKLYIPYENSISHGYVQAQKQTTVSKTKRMMHSAQKSIASMMSFPQKNKPSSYHKPAIQEANNNEVFSMSQLLISPKMDSKPYAAGQSRESISSQMDKLPATILLGASISSYSAKKDVLSGLLNSITFVPKFPDEYTMEKIVEDPNAARNELLNLEAIISLFRKVLKDAGVVSIEPKIANLNLTMSILLETLEKVSRIETLVELISPLTRAKSAIDIHEYPTHGSKEHCLLDSCASLKKNIMSELIAILSSLRRQTKIRYFSAFKQYLTVTFNGAHSWSCILDISSAMLREIFNTDAENNRVDLPAIKTIVMIISMAIIGISNSPEVRKSQLNDDSAPESSQTSQENHRPKSPLEYPDTQTIFANSIEDVLKNDHPIVNKPSIFGDVGAHTLDTTLAKLRDFIDLIIELSFKDYKRNQVALKEEFIKLIEGITPLLWRVITIPKLLKFSISCIDNYSADPFTQRKFIGSHSAILRYLLRYIRDAREYHLYEWLAYNLCDHVRKMLQKLSYHAYLPDPVASVISSPRRSGEFQASMKMSSCSKSVLEYKISLLVDVVNIFATEIGLLQNRTSRSSDPRFSIIGAYSTNIGEHIQRNIISYLMPEISNLINIYKYLLVDSRQSVGGDANAFDASSWKHQIDTVNPGGSYSSLLNGPSSPLNLRHNSPLSLYRDTVRSSNRRKQHNVYATLDSEYTAPSCMTDFFDVDAYPISKAPRALSNIALYTLGTIIDMIIFVNGKLFTRNFIISTVKCPVYIDTVRSNDFKSILNDRCNIVPVVTPSTGPDPSVSAPYQSSMLGYLDLTLIGNVLNFVETALGAAENGQERRGKIPENWITARLYSLKCSLIAIRTTFLTFSMVSSAEAISFPSPDTHGCNDTKKCPPSGRPRAPELPDIDEVAVYYTEDSPLNFSSKSLEALMGIQNQKVGRHFSYIQNRPHIQTHRRVYTSELQACHQDKGDFIKFRKKLKILYDHWFAAVKLLFAVINDILNVNENHMIAKSLIANTDDTFYDISRDCFALMKNFISLLLHYNPEEAPIFIREILYNCVRLYFTDVRFARAPAGEFLSRIFCLFHSKGIKLQWINPMLYDSLFAMFIKNEREFALRSEAFCKYLRNSMSNELLHCERYDTDSKLSSYGTNTSISNFYSDLDQYTALINNYVQARMTNGHSIVSTSLAVDVYLFTRSRINIFTSTCLHFLELILNSNINNKNPTEAAEALRCIICILESGCIEPSRLGVLCNFLHSFFTRKKSKTHTINCVWDSRSSRWIQNSFNILLPTEDPRISNNIKLYIAHSIDALKERVVKMFANAGDYEKALSISYLWSEKSLNFFPASSIYFPIPLSSVSSTYQKMANEARIFPCCYFVMFYGSEWTKHHKEGRYIFRCPAPMDISLFSETLLEAYPKATIKTPKLDEYGNIAQIESGRFIYVTNAKPVVDIPVRRRLFDVVPITMRDLAYNYSCCDKCNSRNYLGEYPAESACCNIDMERVVSGINTASCDPMEYIFEMDKKITLTRLLVSSVVFGSIIIPAFTYGYPSNGCAQYSPYSLALLRKRSVTTLTEFESRLRSYSCKNDISHFILSHNNTNSDKSGSRNRDLTPQESQILNYRTDNYLVKTDLSLPSIYTRVKVDSMKSFPLSPVQNAIIATRNKTFQLLEFLYECLRLLEMEDTLKRRTKGWNGDSNTHYKRFSMFTMYLSGVVDARINGGVSVYENTFLNPRYGMVMDKSPKIQEDLKMLRLVIDEQGEVLRCCLDFHKKLVHDDMMPFHINMTEKFHAAYGSSRTSYEYSDNFDPKMIGTLGMSESSHIGPDMSYEYERRKSSSHLSNTTMACNASESTIACDRTTFVYASNLPSALDAFSTAHSTDFIQGHQMYLENGDCVEQIINLFDSSMSFERPLTDELPSPVAAAAVVGTEFNSESIAIHTRRRSKTPLSTNYMNLSYTTRTSRKQAPKKIKNNTASLKIHIPKSARSDT